MNNSVGTADNNSIAIARQDFMTKVYAWMVGGLLLTGLTAWYVYTSSIWYYIASNSILFFGLIIAQLVLVFTLSSRIDKFSKTTASLIFLMYSLLNGLTLSVIFAVYTAESIQNVFFISAAMFGALSIFGYVTKKDLSGMGSFMFMGLIGIILASVINIFIGSSALHFAISVIGVLVFAGLTAYDTQKIKEMYHLQAEGSEAATKGAILGALALYLDFINLFLFLLRLLGGRE